MEREVAMSKIKISICTILFFLGLGFSGTTLIEAADFSGNWQGNWYSDYSGSGDISGSIVQAETNLSGDITLTNTECGDFYNLPLSGTISGNTATFALNAHCPSDGSNNSLRYTDVVISGNTMTGNYSVYSNNVFYDSGYFSLTRPTGVQVSRYRLYNSNDGNHHYTTSLNEYNTLESVGWVQEGESCSIYNNFYVTDSVESVPYYRVYNPNNGEHHYTTAANEYNVLGTIGWVKEGIDGYVYASQVSGSGPLYRLYNPNSGLHHWTMDANERSKLISYGWNDEGIACYVFGSGGSSLTAEAGSSQTVNKYADVTLDGSTSSGAISYKWTQTTGPSVTLSDSTEQTATFKPVSAASYTFELEVSHGTATVTDTVDITVQNISSVSITFPTGEKTYATNQGAITISGNAGEHIQSVALKNDATSTTLDGSLSTGTFTFSNASLAQGDNKLTVTGTDNIGATSEDVIVITYNPDINFLSAPSINPDSALVSTPTEVTVQIGIESNPNLIDTSVKLIEVDSSGNAISEVTTLYDDGNVANGDDIAGDAVFSAKVSINETTTGTKYFRISADTGSIGYSTVVEFKIMSPLSDQQVKDAKSLVQAKVDSLPDVGVKFTEAEFSQIKDQVVADLLADNDIESAQLANDGNSISIKFKSGLSYNIFFTYGDSKGGREGNNYQEKNNNIINYYPNYSVMSLKSYGSTQKNLLYAAATNNEFIGSYKAAAFSPFEWQFGNGDDIYGAYSVIENSQSPDFQTSPGKTNYDVTVEDFKNLSQYGVVVISSHGTTRMVKQDFSSDNLSEWNWGYEVSVIVTGEEATTEKQKQYQADIDAERLIIGKKIKILVEDDGFLWFDSKEKKDIFLIAPDFVSTYNEDLPNTIIYMSICKGLDNDKLSDAFIQAGAGAYLGYTDTVKVSYAFNAGNTFFEEMLSGKTVEQAVNAATSAHGANDGDSTPAAFEYRGKGNLVLEKVGLLNSGFEDNFKYWESNGGDARIISQLASLSPQEGLYMAIISSGLGSVTDSDAIITQQFKVPAGVSTLSFHYDVVSEEPMEYVGSQFDDNFEVSIIDSVGSEVQVAYETVNSSTWIEIAGAQSDGGMFDGGDSTTYHTGWKNFSYDISAYAGQTITLKFRVSDVGDSKYDTAALIDNIQLN